MYTSNNHIKKILGLIIFAFLLTACGSNLTAEPSEEMNTSSINTTVTRFSATPPLGKAPLKVTFDTSYRSIYRSEKVLLWGFGDGSAKVWGKRVKHTYTKPGTYSATLDVTLDTTASQTPDAAISVTVLPASSKPHENKPPIAAFTISEKAKYRCNRNPPDALFIFNAVASNDLDGEIVSYKWEFDDGIFYGRSIIRNYKAANTFQPPSHANPPIRKVKLTVKDSAGKTSSVEMRRTFEPSPTRCGTYPSDPGN